MVSKSIKYVLSIVSFLLIFCLAHLASASLLNENTMPSMKLLQDNVDGLTRVERIDVAKKLINNLDELERILPKLSMISKRNLEEQKNAIDGKNNFFNKKGDIDKGAMEEWGANLRSYYDNPDSYLYELISRIDTLKVYLTTIINEKNVSNEMYYWSIVSAIFLDEQWDISVNTLISEDKIKNVNMGNSDSSLTRINRLGHLYHNFGMGILMNIITPYLKKD